MRLYLVLSALVVATVLGTPAFAIALFDQALPKGKSRLVQAPDYVFKLVEAIKWNSGYKEDEADPVTRILRRVGVLNLPSADLYAIDRQLRDLLDPVFAKYFPKRLEHYNLVLLNGDGVVAMVYPGKHRRSVPTIFIDRWLVTEGVSEDEVLGVIFHEVGHVLRAQFNEDPWFDRATKAMTEESLVDAFATRMLIETNRNPLGYSHLLERALEIDRQPHHPYKVREGFGSHPPTEARLTHVNALIERAAERRSFPALQPLRGPLARMPSAPALGEDLAGVQFATAEAETLAAALGRIYLRLRLPEAETLRAVERELEIVLARVTPRSAAAWGLGADWTEVAAGLHKMWRSASTKLGPATQTFFDAAEDRVRRKATELKRTFHSYDERQVRTLGALAKLDTAAAAVAWADAPELARAEDAFGYSVYRDPALFDRAFANYLNLIPALFADVDQAFDAQSAARLAELRRLRDVVAAYLHPWMDLKLNQRALHTPDDSKQEVDRKQLARELFGEWDQRLAELPAPALAKLIFVPSLKTNHFGWTLYGGFWEQDQRGLSGSPIFPAGLDFLFAPARADARFASFDRALRILRALHPENPMHFDGDIYGNKYERHGLPLRFDDSTKWLARAVAELRLTGPDAFALLDSPLYWEKTPPRNRERYREVLGGIKDSAVWVNELLGERVRRRQRRRLDRDVNQTIDGFFEENFYHRAEYRQDPANAERLQILIYENLKRNSALPTDPVEEIALWTKFAKRGVTTLTDEWAEIIIKRFQATPEKSPALHAAIEGMYFSNLVWTLHLRETLAEHVYSVDRSPIIRRLHASASAKRRPWLFGADFKSRAGDIKVLMDQVRHEFPESSQERVYVADRIAERIRANPAETTAMMKLVDHEDRALDDLSITRKQGLGIRLYAQLFAELRTAGLRTQLALLDFLLGKTDEVPPIIRPPLGYEPITQEEKDERPVLATIRREIRPYRLRSAFQANAVEVRAIILDPFFLGKNGIIESPAGRQWIIDTLLPADASWRQMAIDLVEGYREALNLHGQGHLKTMFISYLVASSARSVVRTDYSHLFSRDGAPHESETAVGKMLRALFSANAALQKIGQRIHSSNVLAPEVNVSIGALKESAARILREDQHAWLGDAGLGDDIDRVVQIQEELGNASVKVVLNARVNGVDSVLYLIKPNARLRGEIFFRMIEHAVAFAIERGHEPLRLVQGMIRRARETFVRETDLNVERTAAARLRGEYSPETAYGEFHFVTPEFLDTHDVLDATRAAAVKKIKVRRFTELDADERRDFARAVAAKEADVHRKFRDTPDVITFDKDRHEGNYLLVDDEAVAARLGLSGRKLILVIDYAQTAEIAPPVRERLLEAVAIIGAHQGGMLDADRAARRLATALAPVMQTPTAIPFELVRGHVVTAAAHAEGLKPGEMLSRILSYLEPDGFSVRDDVMDYLTALATMQTWDKYEPANAFTTTLRGEVFGRCAKLLSSAD